MKGLTAFCIMEILIFSLVVTKLPSELEKLRKIQRLQSYLSVTFFLSNFHDTKRISFNQLSNGIKVQTVSDSLIAHECQIGVAKQSILGASLSICFLLCSHHFICYEKIIPCRFHFSLFKKQNLSFKVLKLQKFRDTKNVHKNFFN